MKCCKANVISVRARQWQHLVFHKPFNRRVLAGLPALTALRPIIPVGLLVAVFAMSGVAGRDKIAVVCVWMGSRLWGDAAAIWGLASTPGLCVVFWGGVAEAGGGRGSSHHLSPCLWLIGSREVILCEYVALGSRVPRAVVVEGVWYRG